MAISKDGNIIVKNMNYTPNSNAIDKANDAVNTDRGTLERVPDSGNSLSMEHSSNVLGILRNIEKTQIAHKISQSEGLEKLTDIIESSNFLSRDDTPLRNNYPVVTDVTDKLDKIKTELGQEDPCDETREMMLEELYTINKNLEGNNNDVAAAFAAAAEEEKKYNDLQAKVAEQRQKVSDEQNKNTITKIGGWINNKTELVADTLKNGLEQTGKIFMSAMGDADQKLYGGLLTAVSAFKAAQEAVNKTADNIKSGYKWLKGDPDTKNKLSKEEEQLKLYEEQLDAMLNQYQATKDLADSFKMDQTTKNSFQDIMLQNVKDIEKDLSGMLKTFGDTDTSDMTCANLLENLDAVTDLALHDGNIENIRDALNTPIDMPLLDYKSEELQGMNPDIIDQWDTLQTKLDETDIILQSYNDNQNTLNDGLIEGNSSVEKIGRGVEVFSTLATVFNTLKNGAMAMGVTFGALGGMFSLVPILIISGIVGLIAGIVYYADEISAAWDDMSMYFNEKWSEMIASWDAFWDDPFGALSNAWNSFISGVMDIIPDWMKGDVSVEETVKEAREFVDPEGQAKKTAENRVMEQYEKYQAKKTAKEDEGGSNTTVVDNSTNSNSNIGSSGGGGNKTHIYSGVPSQGTSQRYTYAMPWVQ